jgi:hypothetical protein
MATARMILRLHQIARLRICGVKDAEIAKALCMTYPALYRITRLREYQDLESSLLHGHLSALDARLAANVNLSRQVSEIAVPAAMRRIVELALQNTDLKTALAASSEILDRDANRTHVHVKDALTAGLGTGPGLPQVLLESISKDADGVAVSVAQKLIEAQRAAGSKADA